MSVYAIGIAPTYVDELRRSLSIADRFTSTTVRQSSLKYEIREFIPDLRIIQRKKETACIATLSIICSEPVYVRLASRERRRMRKEQRGRNSFKMSDKGDLGLGKGGGGSKSKNSR